MREMFGPPRRPERGEVRYLILGVLADGPCHGYQIIQTIEQRSNGAYRPSPGTIYPNLQLLEEMGSIEAQQEEGRKVYSLTEQGRQEYEERREDVEDSFERLDSHADWVQAFDFHELSRRVRRLLRGVGKGVRTGRVGRSEMKQIRQAIDEAIERIEDILKGGRSQNRVSED